MGSMLCLGKGEVCVEAVTELFLCVNKVGGDTRDNTVGIMPFPKLGVVGKFSAQSCGEHQGGRAGPHPS